MNQLPKRLHSIDVLRAITMLLMIFVNDVSTVKNIPQWIEHVDANADGLGFADIVFPAFLFIVGLSLPFAIRNRIDKGKSFADIALYISTRSLALLVMGFFHVNGENYSSFALLPQPVWVIITTLAFFLIWLDYSPAISNLKKYSLVGGGIILLLVMAYLFKGGEGLTPHGMRVYWWGILGIIGWAYLVCALLFLIVKGRLNILIAIFVLFAMINIFIHAGFIRLNIPVIGDASAVTLVMAGVVVAGMYGWFADKKKAGSLLPSLVAAGAIAIISGWLLRPYTGGISKIHSTPAWVFICMGITILVFTALIWLIDFKGRQRWFALIKPAGTSTLTCYLPPYLLYAIFSLINFKYPVFLNDGVGGIVRSFAIAFIVIAITGRLEKYRLRLAV